MRTIPCILTFFLLACSDNTVKSTNSAPEVLISSHSNNSAFYDGELITFRAEVSDSDEVSSNLRTSWYLNNTLMCDWTNADSNGTSQCAIPISMGATSVQVTVKDSLDAAAMDSITIQIFPTSPDDSGDVTPNPTNEPPVVFITNPENGDIFYVGETIVLHGIVEDDQDNAEDLRVEWTSNISGILDITSADATGNIEAQTSLPIGQHIISLKVTDLNNASTTKSNLIEVQDSPLPTVQCQITAPNNGETIIIGNSGNQFIMEGFVGSNGLLEDLSFNFASSIDGWLHSGPINPNGTVGWTGTALSEATHTFTLDIQYMGQTVCSDSKQVTIEQPLLSISHKNVFVSSQRHDGNFGGLTGADAFCQSLANNAGLTGTYLAWLSDSTGSPSTRFTYANVPYRLVDGTTIANDWNDLTDGTIQNPINLDEYGIPTGVSMVYSFTMINGSAGLFGSAGSNCYGGDCHCNNWTNPNSQGSPTPGSAVGRPNYTDNDWTDYSFGNFCDPNGYPIYCFQQ